MQGVFYDRKSLIVSMFEDEEKEEATVAASAYSCALKKAGKASQEVEEPTWEGGLVVDEQSGWTR